MKITYLLGLAITAPLLAACGGGTGSSELAREQTAITFESYAVDAIARDVEGDSTLGDGSDLVRVVAEGVLPTAIGGELPTELRDSLERLGGVSFAADGMAQPRLDEGFKLTDRKADNTQACSLISTSLNVAMLTPRVAVWKSSAYYYMCGAAHGMAQTRFLNYDRATGKILTQADLFRPGYEAGLKALLRAKLKDVPDLFVAPDAIEIPAEFCITDSGVMFSYGLYSIAPYSSGEIAVNLTASEVYELLSGEGKAILYGEKDDEGAQSEMETRE